MAGSSVGGSGGGGGGGDLAGWLPGWACLLQTLGTSVQPWPNTTRQGLPGGSLAGARWLWLGPLWVGLGGGGGLGLSLANPGKLGDEHHVTMATLLG